MPDLDSRDLETLHRRHRGDQSRRGVGTGHPAEVAMVSLQRLAGNAAVEQMLVQRCGPVPCDCSDEERAAHGQEATGSTAVQRQDDDQAPSAQPPVFICAKPLSTSPIGNHAFFRIGGSGPGNHTIELEPGEVRPDCYQGVPQSDFDEDFNSDTKNCLPVPSAAADLESQSAAYPRGHYCTLGPNSNTFIGVLARNTGAGAIRPSGWLPGFDDPPPPAGTFAPSPLRTLFGCTTKECPSDADQDRQRQQDQRTCVMDMGACGIPGGIPTDDDKQRWNDDCRNRTGYSGPDIIPSPDDCAGHGPSEE
jgi:hypothetical protein